MNEHNYCLPPVYGDLDFLVSEIASNELEGADADAAESLDMAEAEPLVTAPVRKPRMHAKSVIITPTVPLEMNATSTNTTLKRKISQEPEEETRKPPRKKTKAGEGDRTGSVVRMTAVLPNGLSGTLIPL